MKCLVCLRDLLSFRDKNFCGECKTDIKDHFERVDPRNYSKHGFVLRRNTRGRQEWFDDEGKKRYWVGEKNVQYMWVDWFKLAQFLKNSNKGEDIAARLLEI